MTGPEGGADPDSRPGRRWDVALSFAGAQRDYVGQVAVALKERGVRCFYDADEQVRLWGAHLAEELPRIYTRESAAVVVFISADYAGGDWTRLERRAAFSRAVAQAGAYVLPARFDDSDLPGLLPDVVAVDLRRYTPGEFADLVVEKLADLAISPSPPDRTGRRPAGGVRAGEADPRRLGVHAAISVPGVPDEIPPEYVPRDIDAAEFGIRVRVAAAAQRGGFVLLVGGSSVGKTRCAVEAVKAMLPDWWLVRPAGPAEVAALAASPFPRMVVWLDELQRYLDGERGLTGAAVWALLNAPDPVVIIGTLWPDRYTAYTALPAVGSADLHAREREVLDLAAVIRIDAEFSPAEQDRARAAAARDARLRVALQAAGYGLTQTLAAAPQLVARWQDAQTATPYAWAVITAALDAARLGARAPLSAEFLRAAAPDYCTGAQQAEAPRNWFEQALAYATGKLHGAAAALSPSAAGMGQVTGYTVADYLIQHVSRERRYARVPASTWDAVLSHIRDPADAARLADSARYRLLYRYAISLYRHAANAGDKDAASQLEGLLADQGNLDRAARLNRHWQQARRPSASRPPRIARRGNAGDKNATRRRERLRATADADDGADAIQLAMRLADQGNLDGLRARADAGDRHAVVQLAMLLADRGDLDGLRAWAHAGDPHIAVWLAKLLARHGDLDQAVQILRARADAGHEAAAAQLAVLLADLQRVRARADAGNRHAAVQLAILLADRGDLEGLRARADAGDGAAALELAALLADRGDLEGLRARADAGDPYVAMKLAMLLSRRGDLEGLRARADAGDPYAGRWLPGLLIKQGRGEEAERLRRFGLNPDGSIARE